MTGTRETLDKIERVKLILTQRATGGQADEASFVKLRRELLADASIKAKLPGFLRVCTNVGEFWGFIKQKFPSYQERRDFLRDEFLPAIQYLENGGSAPADEAVSAVLSQVDSEHVRDAWLKALDRRESDPDGAITSARSLIESVCKHILDKSSVAYPNDWDLAKLYGETAKQLKLSPGQHGEDIFKQILSGCHTVIHGMSGLRNSFGDAHGKGRAGVKPAPRHAELAVNLAGSMATFLIATWEAKESRYKALEALSALDQKLGLI
ncbi:MAG: abortive infection family protein [Gemmataceae bacterium]